MLVLALDTTTAAGGVALWDDGVMHAATGDPARKHGARLPGDVLDLLAAHSKELRDVSRFAVVSGPGSFTGLRVGMAAIQGFAMATGRSVVPVTTFDAIFEGWRQHGDQARPIVVACQDAQRGDLFLAVSDTSAPGAAGQVLIDPRVVDPATAAALVATRLDRARVVLIGDAVARHADLFGAHLPDVPQRPPAEPLAASAARLAAREDAGAVPPSALQPLYLRRPDVELARDRRAGREASSSADRRAGASGSESTFVIRRATGQEDLSAVDGLQQLTFTNPWGAEAIRWELEHTEVARLYLMTAPTGVLVAYCACWMVADEVHINSLAVDPAWRRQGLARRLLRHVFRDTVRDGAASATLEVRQSNDAARALYAGLGFAVEGRRRDYYQQPREDALILWHRTLATTLLVAP